MRTIHFWDRTHAHGLDRRAGANALRYVVPVGRVLFALIFLTALPSLFSSPVIAYAAAQGVPLAKIAVPLAGIIAFLGGLSVALGYRARIGAWLLVLFLVPVTLAMHAFWRVADPVAAQGEQINFMKNVSMLGAALLIAWFGAGPLSLDSAEKSRPKKDGVIPED
jgi:putative oxidoreductase